MISHYWTETVVRTAIKKPSIFKKKFQWCRGPSQTASSRSIPYTFSYVVIALKHFIFLSRTKTKLDLKPVSENHHAFPGCTSETQLSIVKLLPCQYQQYRTEPEDSAHRNKPGSCVYRQMEKVINRWARRKERKKKRKTTHTRDKPWTLGTSFCLLQALYLCISHVIRKLPYLYRIGYMVWNLSFCLFPTKTTTVKQTCFFPLTNPKPSSPALLFLVGKTKYIKFTFYSG